MKLILLVFSCLAASTLAQTGLNILDVARRHGLYSFIFALEETNNLDFLAKAENVTVFIPTNDAFRNVSDAERNKWRSNPAYYQDLLRYHVVQGRYTKLDFLNRDEDQLNTAAKFWPTVRFVNYTGYSLDIQMYEDAVIGTYDIEASNGVIHLLDQVVSAPENQTILQILESRSDLLNITALIKNSTMITEWLNGSKPGKPVTFLAPDDNATKKLSPAVWNKLITNTGALEEVLSYQILDQGTWFSRSLKDGLNVRSLNKNGNRTVQVTKDGVWFDKAGVLAKDLAATNGVVHTVDTLVFPVPWLEL